MYGNNMILLAQDNSKKEESQHIKKKEKTKNDGMKEIFSLMQEMKDFQSQLEKCAEAQEVDDVRNKILSFDTEIVKMFDVLVDITKQSIRREKEQIVTRDNEENADLEQPSYNLSNISEPATKLIQPSSPIF